MSLATSRSLWALTAYYVFASFGWSFFVSWMPRYLDDVHHMKFDVSESVWKQPLLYGGLSCLAGGVLSDWLVRRSGRKWLGRALFPLTGMTTAAAAIYCVRFVDDPDYAVALMCLAGAAHDFGQGANWVQGVLDHSDAKVVLHTAGDAKAIGRAARRIPKRWRPQLLAPELSTDLTAA